MLMNRTWQLLRHIELWKGLNEASLCTLEMSWLQTRSWEMCSVVGEAVPPLPLPHTENRRLRIPSKLIEIRFDQGRYPEDLGYRHEGGKPRNITGQMVYILISQHGSNSKTG